MNTINRVSIKPADPERKNAIQDQEPKNELQKIKYIVLSQNS